MNAGRMFLMMCALALAALSVRAEDPPPTLEALDREVHELTLDLRQARQDLESVQQRIETIEKRLGETFRLPSPFDTIERRLEDLEKEVDRLKRR